MTRSLLLLVDRFNNPEAVLGVDAEQLQDHESHGAPFVGGFGLHPSPQVWSDAPQGVVEHAEAILPAGGSLRTHRPSRPSPDGFEVAA